MSSYDEAREAAYGAWVRALVNDEPINYVPILNDAQKLRIDAAIDAFLGALSADSEMVERVARIICASTGGEVWDDPVDWSSSDLHLLEPGRENYRTLARAAIAAMLAQEVKG